MKHLFFFSSRSCYMSSFGLSLCPQGMHELLAPIVFVLHCDHQAFQHASETASPRSVPPSCGICTLRRCRARRMFAFICIIFVSQWGDEVSVEPSVPWARRLVSRDLFKSSKLVSIPPPFAPSHMLTFVCSAMLSQLMETAEPWFSSFEREVRKVRPRYNHVVVALLWVFIMMII